MANITSQIGVIIIASHFKVYGITNILTCLGIKEELNLASFIRTKKTNELWSMDVC